MNRLRNNLSLFSDFSVNCVCFITVLKYIKSRGSGVIPPRNSVFVDFACLIFFDDTSVCVFKLVQYKIKYFVFKKADNHRKRGKRDTNLKKVVIMYIKQYKKELKSMFNEKRHTGFEVEKTK